MIHRATATVHKSEFGDVMTLRIDGGAYGDYPIGEGHNALAQAKMMLADAKDFGCSCIELLIEET